jgi:hypothetical protein
MVDAAGWCLLMSHPLLALGFVLVLGLSIELAVRMNSPQDKIHNMHVENFAAAIREALSPHSSTDQREGRE